VPVPIGRRTHDSPGAHRPDATLIGNPTPD
jgi:hypothetical protein